MTLSQRLSNLDFSFSHLCNVPLFSQLNLGCSGHFSEMCVGTSMLSNVHSVSICWCERFAQLIYTLQATANVEADLLCHRTPRRLSLALELKAANIIRLLGFCHRGRRIATIIATIHILRT